MKFTPVVFPCDTLHRSDTRITTSVAQRSFVIVHIQQRLEIKITQLMIVVGFNHVTSNIEGPGPSIVSVTSKMVSMLTFQIKGCNFFEPINF